MEERYGCWEGEGEGEEEKRWAWGGRELVIYGGGGVVFCFLGLWFFVFFYLCCPYCGRMCCVKVGRESGCGGGGRRGMSDRSCGTVALL